MSTRHHQVPKLNGQMATCGVLPHLSASCTTAEVKVLNMQQGRLCIQTRTGISGSPDPAKHIRGVSSFYVPQHERSDDERCALATCRGA